MADNIGYTPGTGTQIAADDVGGVLYQRVKPVHGSDGTAVDTSATNPLPVQVIGDLANAIESLREALTTLNRRQNLTRIDAAGRQFTIMDSSTTINGMSTVTTVSGLTNINGVPGFDLIRSSSRTAFNTGLRSNLTFS
jgi:hypothetical protein